MRDFYGTERVVMRLWRVVIVAGVFFVLTGMLSAQRNEASVQQLVIVEVKPITHISINGNPQSFFIQDPPDGSDFATAADNSTQYDVLTNLENMKIVASINTPMPRGTRLLIDLASTKGASNGVVDISNAITPVTAVSGIGRGSDRHQQINYVFAANAIAGDIDAESRIVTLTVTD
jgi:hypothetical protein